MKKILTLFAFFLACGFVHAQDMLGVRSSNYSGLQSLGINPALIQNSRLDIDVNILGIAATAENDFLYIDKDDLKFFGIKNMLNRFNDGDYIDEFKFNNPDELHNASSTVGISGLGVLFSIKNKHAIAVTTQMRFAMSAHDVQAHVGKYAVEGLGYDPLHGILFHAEDFKMDFTGWFEYGLSYATTIYENEKGALTGGLTFKYLNGIGGAYTENVDMYYNVLNDSDMVFLGGSSIDYGRTDYNSFDDIGGYSDMVNGKGVGVDIGLTYDFLKDPAEWKYEMDGKKLADPTKNRYKVRLGVSLLDLGKIKFDENSATFHLETADSAFYYNYDVDEFENNIDFDTSMSAIFYDGAHFASFRDGNFYMSLPTSLSVQADWNVIKNLYVNGTFLFGFDTKKHGATRPNVYAITPRYETRWFDVSMPISYYYFNEPQTRLGLAVRFASFYIGSDRIGTMFGFGDMTGMDVYAGLKFSINKERIRDYDGDRVSDKMDKCREVAGKLKFDGCPDRDNDDIPDMQDKCPDVPGIPELEGCPDRDGDGITDAADACPDNPGPVELNGCPDTDGDGVIDMNDECPAIPGLELYKGCPDTDLDSIPDPKDDCPTEKGLPEFNGCPDTDGDGIPDPKDDCPFDVGPPANKGCPVKVTQAPVQIAPVAVQLSAEEQEIINKVFSNLEFESGKSVIKKSSYSSLDELAELMKKKTSFKLKITGHTDSVGSASSNMTLSKKRAGAAKTYLVDKGVDAGRITADGMGESKPIATNDTPEGRAKNRRVEFLIVE